MPRPLYALIIGTSEVYKDWGVERFGALATRLRACGYGVICVGGPAEVAVAEAIRARVPETLQDGLMLSTQGSVLTTAAILRNCNYCVGNDTGALQIGAANDVPCLCILGDRPLLDHDPLIHMIVGGKVKDISLDEVASAAQRLLKQTPNKPAFNDALELIEAILVSRFPQLTTEAMQIMLNIITANDIRHTRFYQDAFGDGEQKGLERGLEKGLQKGEAELILRLLARRCGEVSAQQKSRIMAMPTDKLDALGEALLDFTDWADLDAWFRVKG